jgi:hypothetical protein
MLTTTGLIRAGAERTSGRWPTVAGERMHRRPERCYAAACLFPSNSATNC